MSIWLKKRIQIISNKALVSEKVLKHACTHTQKELVELSLKSS